MTEDIEIGDKVRTSYFGCGVIGTVLKVTKRRVRVVFRNQSGWQVTAWRPREKVKLMKKGVKK